MKITNELLREFKTHLQNKMFSENTIQNYTTDLNQFLNFMKNKNGLGVVYEKEITMIEIEKRTTILNETKTPHNSIYYMKRPTLSPSTIRTKLSAVKSFLKFLNNIYWVWIDYRKIEQKRAKQPDIEILTPTEYQTYFDFIWKYEKYKINQLRSQLLVNIWYTSGMRLSEILNLKTYDILNKETRITGKGNKDRRVFFTNSSVELLKEYLYEREQPIPRTWIIERKTDNVFISHNSWYDYGNQIAKNTMCEILKRYSDELDLWKRITCHTLRHSYATRLLESGMNIREIQELLWHADIQTTERYCHVLKSNLQEKVNAIFN